MISSHWYEAVIDKFGTVENFIDQLCDKQGLTKEEPVSMIQERKKCLTVDELIKELTEEYNTTTIVVTHDMNSVMGIGDYIIFLHEGKKFWEGSNKEIFKTDNEAVTNFVYSSDLFQRVQKMYLEEDEG